jgi:hypothetical protein
MPPAESLVASTLVLLSVTAVHAQAPVRADYVLLGEGLSSSGPGRPIEYGSPRMFTIYLLDEACRRAGADRSVRLHGVDAPATIRIGEPFSPAELKIVARDAAGRVLPGVPIAIEVKAPTGLFDPSLRDAGGTGPLVPRTAAAVTFRARALCPGPPGEALLEIHAR